jgi:putative transposase
MSHLRVSEDGMMKENWPHLERQEDIECIVSKISNPCLEKQTNPRKRKSVMQESVQIIKKEISKGKSKTSRKNIQTTKSSQILAQDSIGKGRDYTPFWNESTKEMSTKLWWQIETDSVDLDMSSSNLSLKKGTAKSWFSVQIQRKKQIQEQNYQKTFSPSSMFLWQRIMECDQLKIEQEEKEKKSKKRKLNPKEPKEKKKKKEKIPAGKAKKIRIYPNEEQKTTLLKWIGTTRWTYNRCLDAIQKENTKCIEKDIRAVCINNSNFEETDKKWVLDTPYDIRDEAMRDFLKAKKEQKNRQKKGKRVKSMKYRSRKDKTQSIVIHSKHYGHKRGFYSKIFNNNMLSSEPLPDKINYDSRLIVSNLGEFFFCIPLPLEIRCENQAPIIKEWNEGVISLDPGVRTFMTGYDPSGTIVELGKYDIGRIYRLCHIMDKLHSRWSSKETKHKKRHKLKKVASRIRKKIRNLIDDCHKVIIKTLCQNYRIVLLPKFETSQMIRKGQRKISSKAARAMCTWSHYRFRKRFAEKTREFPWCKLVICDEHYTSKTCGRCGELNHKLGGSKTFHCEKCGIVIDRDINGARNILLRYLTLSESPDSRCGLAPGSNSNVASCKTPKTSI